MPLGGRDLVSRHLTLPESPPSSIDVSWQPFRSKRFMVLKQTHPGLVMPLPMVRYATTEEGLLKHWYRSLVPNVRLSRG